MNNRCIQCNNNKYLHNGICIDRCPDLERYSEIGSNNLNRVCNQKRALCSGNAIGSFEDV